MGEKNWRRYKHFEFCNRFEGLIRVIEDNLGEPFNPDDMLAEGRALKTELDNTLGESMGSNIGFIPHSRNEERAAFRELVAALSKAKKFVVYFGGKEWIPKLDVPTRIPRTRPTLREAVRAVLSAWDEHSADPELVHVAPAMDGLSDAFDAFEIAWDIRQDALRQQKEITRAFVETRARCEDFVSRVKKYLGLYLDPYSSKYYIYGFRPRKKREKKDEGGE